MATRVIDTLHAINVECHCRICHVFPYPHVMYEHTILVSGCCCDRCHPQEAQKRASEQRKKAGAQYVKVQVHHDRSTYHERYTGYTPQLGGGFTYFVFHPYLGRWSNLTNIFWMGWNHQLVKSYTEPKNDGFQSRNLLPFSELAGELEQHLIICASKVAMTGKLVMTEILTMGIQIPYYSLDDHPYMETMRV